MSTPFKIIISVLFFLVLNFFSSMILSAAFQLLDQHVPSFIINILHTSTGLILSALCTLFLWRRLGTVAHSRTSYILLGGLLVGAIGLIGGVAGPILLIPESNLGPLLGIFITGPLGLVIGLFGGAIVWNVKQKKSSN